MQQTRKRKAPYPSAKRLRLYRQLNANRTGEVKFTSSAFTASGMAFYAAVTNINTSGERNGRIGTKIYLSNLHWQFYAKYLGSGQGPLMVRVLVVQSKQGMLAGVGGDVDAPLWDGEANHDAYKVLYDEYHALQYGDDDLCNVFNIRVKLNSMLKYKNYPSTDYECDKPVYIWVRSTNENSIGGTVMAGRYQLYWKDV